MPTRMIDLLEAAACLWEAALNSRNPRITQWISDEGTSSVRLTIVGWAEDVHHAWEANCDHLLDSFDWDFVPEWLDQKVKEHLSA